MLDYYKNKMNKSHGLYQKALDEGNEDSANALMVDYVNYKEMYDSLVNS